MSLKQNWFLSQENRVCIIDWDTPYFCVCFFFGMGHLTDSCTPAFLLVILCYTIRIIMHEPDVISKTSRYKKATISSWNLPREKLIEELLDNTQNLFDHDKDSKWSNTVQFKCPWMLLPLASRAPRSSKIRCLHTVPQEKIHNKKNPRV